MWLLPDYSTTYTGNENLRTYDQNKITTSLHRETKVVIQINLVNAITLISTYVACTMSADACDCGSTVLNCPNVGTTIRNADAVLCKDFAEFLLQSVIFGEKLFRRA